MTEKYRWEQDPSRKNCADSEQLDGQIKTLSEWQTTVMPGSTKTACRGDCDCKLVPVPDSSKLTKNPIRVPDNLGAPILFKMSHILPDGTIRANSKNRPEKFAPVTPDNKVVNRPKRIRRT